MRGLSEKMSDFLPLLGLGILVRSDSELSCNNESFRDEGRRGEERGMYWNGDNCRKAGIQQQLRSEKQEFYPDAETC
jgi:hypothetical protein